MGTSYGTLDYPARKQSRSARSKGLRGLRQARAQRAIPHVEKFIPVANNRSYNGLSAGLFSSGSIIVLNRAQLSLLHLLLYPISFTVLCQRDTSPCHIDP